MKKIVVVTCMLVVIMVVILPTLIISSINGIHSQPENHNNTLKDENIKINIYFHKEKKIRAMNLEEYIVGVVAAEMPAEFEREALKAQAVAARTYAVKHMLLFGGSGAPDCPDADISTDYGQGQAWLSQEQLKERWGNHYGQYIEKINQAVAETKNQAITYDGEVINAVFHSTSGERTASAKEVWGFDYPYLISVPCPWDQSSPRYQERKEFSLAEIEKKLGAETQVVAAAQNGSGLFQVVDTTDSGRVGQIRIGSKVLSGQIVREKLDLRSTHFRIEMQDGKMIVDTIGYGHGVGLCQYGANGMAKAGKDYRQIISTYYTGVVIQSIIAP